MRANYGGVTRIALWEMSRIRPVECRDELHERIKIGLSRTARLIEQVELLNAEAITTHEYARSRVD